MRVVCSKRLWLVMNKLVAQLNDKVCIPIGIFSFFKKSFSGQKKRCLVFMENRYSLSKFPILFHQALGIRRKWPSVARTAFDDELYLFRKPLVVEALQHELQRANLDSVDPEVLLREIETHTGLLVERAIDVYSFSHLTLQEFFTALAYQQEGDEVELFRRTVEVPRYREVFLMALERAYRPESLLLAVIGYTKNEYIDRRCGNAYIQGLIESILTAQISMDPIVRNALLRVHAELIMQDVESALDDESHLDDGDLEFE